MTLPVTPVSSPMSGAVHAVPRERLRPAGAGPAGVPGESVVSPESVVVASCGDGRV